ncbi:uncharacterized protein [Linepithema humile]|uniref:uncharacterized protein n=1 Tax=Linepithema humile TaxID=83485 RepID=UPI00351E6966
MNGTSYKFETWKYYDKLVRCPACNVKDVPIILKQQNFTSSRLAAFCLLGCWPFCFIPLLMSRDKKMRMQCPHCGHDCDYDIRLRTDKLACSPKCQSNRGKFSDFANSRQCHLQTECNSSQIQSEYRYRQKTLSTGDEVTRALRASEERPRRGEGGSRRRRSQSQLSHGYAFYANQVTNHSSPYHEGSSDNCTNERRNCQRDSNEPKVLKAPGRSESEDSSRTGMFDFYARQVCCRECG